MMGTKNAQDAHTSRHVLTMGPKLGPLFYTLVQRTMRLHTLFDEHEALFGDREHVPLLNQVASSFFYLVDYSLWESMLLGIAQLTDPAVSGRGKGAKVNVTLCRLPAEVREEHRSEVQASVEAAVRAAAFCGSARDKLIAHLDDRLMLDLEHEPVTLGSREEVRKSLNAIASTLNLVQQRYEDAHTIYRAKVKGGARSLLRRISGSV